MKSATSNYDCGQGGTNPVPPAFTHHFFSRKCLITHIYPHQTPPPPPPCMNLQPNKGSIRSCTCGVALKLESSILKLPLWVTLFHLCFTSILRNSLSRNDCFTFVSPFLIFFFANTPQLQPSDSGNHRLLYGNRKAPYGNRW